MAKLVFQSMHRFESEGIIASDVVANMDLPPQSRELIHSSFVCTQPSDVLLPMCSYTAAIESKLPQ